MPEFELDHGGAEGSKAFDALDSFTQGYVTAMFFTATDWSDKDESDNPNEHPDWTFADLSVQTLLRINADCAAFQKAGHDSYLAIENYEIRHKQQEAGSDSIEAAGRDFWYTRNGHGCGFWDGDWPEPFATRLTDLAKSFATTDLYRGDDGKLYLE